MKTVSYGLVHVVVATVVAYSLTQDLAVSLGIGLIEPLVQTVVFAIHDYVWEGNQTSLQHDNMLEIGG